MRHEDKILESVIILPFDIVAFSHYITGTLLQSWLSHMVSA